MLEVPAMWGAIIRFVEYIMSAKDEVERDRQWEEGVAWSRRWWAGRAELIGSTEFLYCIIFFFILGPDRRGIVSNQPEQVVLYI